LTPRKWHSGEELLWSSRTTLEQFAPAPERNPGLKGTCTDAIFEKFNVKTNFKLTNKCDPEIFQIYPTKPSIGLPNLVSLSL
jgi:hypothetical protein